MKPVSFTAIKPVALLWRMVAGAQPRRYNAVAFRGFPTGLATGSLVLEPYALDGSPAVPHSVGDDSNNRTHPSTQATTCPSAARVRGLLLPTPTFRLAYCRRPRWRQHRFPPQA